MNLSNLKRQLGNKRNKKRAGRGFGSGKGGHTIGHGAKGQKVRGRRGVNPGFEGGQVPIFKKVPKNSGFRSINRKAFTIVSIVKLNEFKDGDTVTPQILLKKGYIRRVLKHGVKLLTNGKLHRKLILEGFVYTNSAQKAIEASGSTIK